MWPTVEQWLKINTETGVAELTWPLALILIIAGFLVGAINTFAGSGTVITYSLFMFLGLPANVANGTIRFGVIMQTLATSATFWDKGYLPVKKGVWLSLPIIIGTVAGALTAAQINQDVFKKILAVLMLLMLAMVFYDPKKWLSGQLNKIEKGITWKQWLLFLTIGIYGGFIHIGVGIFLLSALVLNVGFDLLRANALKVFIVFLYSPFALAVFMYYNQVNYSLGLVSAIGNVLGGIVASKYAIKKGTGFIRWTLMAIMLLFSIYLFIF